MNLTVRRRVRFGLSQAISKAAHAAALALLLSLGLSIDANRLSAQIEPPAEFEQLLEEFFRGEMEGGLIPRELLEELMREGELNRPTEAAPRSPDRDREPSPFERNHPSQLAQFKPLTKDTRQWVATVYADGQIRSLGTVIHSDGLLITKASEIEDLDDIKCQLSDGRVWRAELIDTRKEHDLALLEIATNDLQPVEWHLDAPVTGNLVVSGDRTGEVLSWGVVSVAPRSLMNSNQAVLGVVPQPSSAGIVVDQVQPGSPADEAGIEAGDVVLSIDGAAIETVNGLANTIRLHQPGDSIRVRIRRAGRESNLTAVLAGRNVSGRFSQNLQMMNRFGSEPSRRNSDFPEVVQHDGPLWPEQCGGPLIGLDGKALGINIARGGRVASYAIPARTMQPLVDDWIEKYAR